MYKKMYLISKLAILTMVLQIHYAQKLEIRNLNKDPLLLLKTNECKIQIGNVKIVHPINLTNLQLTVESINKFITNTLNDKDDKLELYNIIKQKCKKLNNNLQQIKPIKRNRQKRWDALGTAWKWLAGSPDAIDLRMLEKTTNELVDGNNEQFQINKKVNERIQMVTDTINRAMTNNNMANRIIITEIEMITVIINIDTINTILEDIQDAIVRTKVGLTSNKIWSLKELYIIKNLMISQGVNITLPEEALQYVVPKVAISEETLLFILETPKLEDERSVAVMIVPLTINNTIIKEYPQHLIKTNRKVFTTSNYKSYVQKHAEIKEFEDDCVKPLVMGTRSICNVTSKTETTIHLITEDKILIDNAKNEILSSDCGPHNRTLTGNFLITFWNCSIILKDKKFQSFEIRSEAQEIQGALHNLQTTRQLIKTINIDLIEQQNLQNRKQIAHMHSRQTDHQYWIWSLSGGISVSSVSIIILCIYIHTRQRITRLEIKDSSGPRLRTSDEKEQTHYSDILVKLGIKTKDGDALSPPPGGVMLP